MLQLCFNLINMRCFLILLCFSVKFSYLQGFRCGGIFTAKEFSIQSPNYPENYYSKLNCEYVFKGEGCRTEYTLQFLDFDLASSISCNRDHIQIGEKRLCGRQVGSRSYLAENGNLTLKFISGVYTSGTRFNILVTRRPCEINSFNNSLLRSQNCCQNIYYQKRFVLTNPGFPHRTSTPFDCEYKIRRANDRVCKLKFNFKFYWNGVQKEQGCSNGYLEIDNKKICGCRSGLGLSSNFDKTWKNKLKVIKYKTNEYVNKLNGFAIEIIQEECSKKHKRKSRFATYGMWNKANYGYPEYFSRNSYYGSYIAETTYHDTSVFNPTISNENANVCRSIKWWNWLVWAKRTWFGHIPKCNVKPNGGACITFNSVRGDFRSNGYPYGYRNNLKECYRFVQQPGYCSVSIHTLDFDLQQSHGCRKDYLLLENGCKYCGHNLRGVNRTFAFNKSYVDMFFVTDYCICGRGFKGRYEQNPCDISTTKPSTLLPETTTEITTKMSTETTTKIPTEMPTETTTKISTETPTETTTKISTETPTEITTKMSTETTTKISTETPTETTTTIFTEMPTEITTKMSTETTTKIPTEMPTETTTKISTETPTETTTKISTETPTEITTKMSTETTTKISTETPTETTTEISTETPITTLAPLSCGGFISNERFVLEVNGEQENPCIFSIGRFNESVCLLVIKFVDFNLTCENEYLLIDRKMFCGNRSNETYSIDFFEPIEIVYRRKISLGEDKRVSIDLIQNYSDCSPIEPPGGER